MGKAKPFVKWAGGKTNLISQLDPLLPDMFNTGTEVAYVEPFVGGGAMLFHMLNTYTCINKAIINDINVDLIETYRVIKKNPDDLVTSLQYYQDEYIAQESEEQRKNLYLSFRERYNELSKDSTSERVSLFMFLNHTCFNGLYRENKSGKFNVPFGRYAKPSICNKDAILSASEKLQNVEIHCGSYLDIKEKIDGDNIFVYLDPPYRPLSSTSNFNDYNSSGFGDHDQENLKVFCDDMTKIGAKIMLSNSDSEKDGDSYFDTLFQIPGSTYKSTRVMAHRYINAFAVKREKTQEILIRNY